MSTYRMVYKGTRKINAIKAVRKIAGTGLKEAKDAVENDSGFIVFGSSCAAIIAEYVIASKQDTTPCYKMDWAVGEYEPESVIDLRNNSPHMETVLSDCRLLA